MPERGWINAQCDELAFKNQCVSGFAKEAKEAHKLRVEGQRLENKRKKRTGAGCPVRGKRRVSKLEAFLAETFAKLDTAGGRLKELDVDIQEIELQRAGGEETFHALLGKSTDFWRNLYITLLRVSELRIRSSQLVVKEPFVKRIFAVAL